MTGREVAGVDRAKLVGANARRLHPWPVAASEQLGTAGPDGSRKPAFAWAIANASYKRQKRNPGVTEIKKLPDRGHALVIDSGWKEVAETALEFVRRFV